MAPAPIDTWLGQHGLMLCAFHWQDLPESVSESMRQALSPDEANLVNEQTILIVLANAGPNFWQTLQHSSLINNRDPVDDYSVSLARAFQEEFLDHSTFTQLYPTLPNRSHIPLMRIGRLAGWNAPSPLGLGLHPEYGPWSAYRAAWLTQTHRLPKDYFIARNQYEHMDLSSLQNLSELCSTCSAPCATACPAMAVKLGERFNTQACYQHSQPSESECHVHCAARRACPIGQDHQYDNDQLAHHMGMRWRNISSKK